MVTRNLCVSFRFSLVAAAACLAASSSAGQRSATSSVNNTAAVCSPSALQMGFSTTHPSIVAMSETLFGTDMQHNIAEWLTSYRRAFRARNFPSQTTCTQARALPELAIKTNGLQPSKPYASLNQNMSFWKMLSDCSAVTAISDKSSETWPRRGMMLDGTVYPVSMSEQATSDAESGSSESSNGDESETSGTCSNVSAVKNRGVPNVTATGMSVTASEADKPTSTNTETYPVSFKRGQRVWPTPTVNDSKNTAGKEQFNRNSLPLNAAVCVDDGGNIILENLGKLMNPNFVEWLMGWPVDWTGLQPLGTDKYQQWSQLHGRE